MDGFEWSIRTARLQNEIDRLHSQLPITQDENEASLRRPSINIFPPLPEGFIYAKDVTAMLRGQRDPNARREAVYETPWLRTQFHDIYIMSLWGSDDERVLVVEETNLNNKIEEWTSILTALEEKANYIVCEPTQMGNRLKRWVIVGNYLNRMILRTCYATLFFSCFFPHKRAWYWPSFLVGTFCFIIYNDTFCKDPACDYQIVDNHFMIARFPVHRLASGTASIICYKSHKLRWFWQRVIYYTTLARILYLVIFPAPACICDWRAIDAVVQDNIKAGIT